MELPDFTTGSPKQIKWAEDLRERFLRTWPDGTVPRDISLALAGLCDPRWWIDNRTDLAGAMARQLGSDVSTATDSAAKEPSDSEGIIQFAVVDIPPDDKHLVSVHEEYADGEIVPSDPIVFKSRRLSGLEDPLIEWALRKLGFRITPGATWKNELSGCSWTIDVSPISRNNARNTFEPQKSSSESRRPTQNWLPELTAHIKADRRKATEIRRALINKRWGDKVPPAVREALNRLTDADWWLKNEIGDGYPQAIDRAFGDELPEHDRKMMALPKYGPYVPKHLGSCVGRPDYVVMRAAAREVVAEHGDLRSAPLPADIPDETRRSCCGAAGRKAGEAEGKQIWVTRRAAEIRRTNPRSTDPETQARSDLRRMERNLDGWG